MKKLNVILVGLLSILMLSLAIVFINRWKLNEDSQRIVLAEKEKKHVRFSDQSCKTY
ncbi:hypothetical protein HMPREF1231_1677 [Streptococcus pyogenes GA06023]|nr:hypothetical protein HMPREF1231_1677 [Streptococcus pyogenes GA06023]